MCWVQAWDTGFPARQYEPELEKGTARRAAQTQNLMIDSEGAFLGDCSALEPKCLVCSFCSWELLSLASLVAQMVKRLPAIWETQFNPWVGKIPWRRKWQPTPVLLPGKSHGRRSPAATVHGVAKSQTRLSNFTFTFFQFAAVNPSCCCPSSPGSGRAFRNVIVSSESPPSVLSGHWLKPGGI